MSAFNERLASLSQAHDSLVCLGLDPDPDLMAIQDVFEFNKAIIDATKDLVCAYKPNMAFYEALGIPGLKALENTVSHIRALAPEVVVLGDAKRGDIDSTNKKYAKALFEVWGFDAVTVNGFAGGQALEPFFEYEERGVFVWCRSSNLGAGEFQDLSLERDGDKMPLYEWLAKRARHWNSRGNAGVVVGATYPDELRLVRSHCPGMPILIPAVGAQGGELERAVKSGMEDGKNPGILINSSRSILYASRREADFAEAARTSTENLRDQINRILERGG